MIKCDFFASARCSGSTPRWELTLRSVFSLMFFRHSWTWGLTCVKVDLCLQAVREDRFTVLQCARVPAGAFLCCLSVRLDYPSLPKAGGAFALCTLSSVVGAFWGAPVPWPHPVCKSNLTVARIRLLHVAYAAVGPWRNLFLLPKSKVKVDSFDFFSCFRRVMQSSRCSIFPDREAHLCFCSTDKNQSKAKLIYLRGLEEALWLNISVCENVA